MYNLWLIHVDVWQRPAQHCKATILQLKINKLIKKYIDNWAKGDDHTVNCVVHLWRMVLQSLYFHIYSQIPIMRMYISYFQKKYFKIKIILK